MSDKQTEIFNEMQQELREESGMKYHQFERFLSMTRTQRLRFIELAKEHGASRADVRKLEESLNA